MPYLWNEDPTTKITLSNDNEVEVRDIDLPGLVMSADNGAIPNGLLEQISAQLSGQAPDQELVCHSGTRMPNRGEPCSQKQVHGKVVDVIGSEDHFTVRVSVPSGEMFQAGEIRFGGNCNAMVETVSQWNWRIGGGDAERARQEMPQLTEFINLVVRTASVKPQFVTEVTDPETQIDIKRLKLEDKLKIFGRVMPREVRPAGMFPQEQAAGVAAASHVQGVPSESGDGVRTDTPVGSVAV